MNDYDRMVTVLNNDRWHLCLVIADWCEEHGMPALSRAWKWIASNKRWPYKHRSKELYGWYTVSIEQWEEYREKRESAIPAILIGGDIVYQSGSSRRVRSGTPYMKNQYVVSVSVAMSRLANGVTLALLDNAIK